MGASAEILGTAIERYNKQKPKDLSLICLCVSGQFLQKMLMGNASVKDWGHLGHEMLTVHQHQQQYMQMQQQIISPYDPLSSYQIFLPLISTSTGFLD